MTIIAMYAGTSTTISPAFPSQKLLVQEDYFWKILSPLLHLFMAVSFAIPLALHFITVTRKVMLIGVQFCKYVSTTVCDLMQLDYCVAFYCGFECCDLRRVCKKKTPVVTASKFFAVRVVEYL